VRKLNRFAGRTALLTGAGTGAATARRIASEGGTVIVTNSHLPTAESISADLGQLGATSCALQLDV
jgi:NAD(P)-dependent dehydrogenase (short-subunit alcohol dehydrogenase family)